jgi:hypothetical protein
MTTHKNSWLRHTLLVVDHNSDNAEKKINGGSYASSLMKERGKMPVLPLHWPSYQSELTAERKLREGGRGRLMVDIIHV